ncbi:prolyl 4-hydroxylase subunit alpha-1-like isoform X2 [Ptychodera flava]|uniref:prolyl 4-hydroxylase subunit alpha-1-like isoform X2 n=1 Tax=Ptychodera flava TaxID=63121 RepID=UPI003969ED71
MIMFIQTTQSTYGTFKTTGDIVSNPVSAFQLIKRLHLDWRNINNKTTDLRNYKELKANLANHRVHIPKDSDLRGAAKALLRLEDVYQLEPQTIVQGDIGGVSATRLRPEDCFDLGRAAYLSGDHYHTEIWLNEALALWKREEEQRTTENPFNVSKVLDYLAFSHYQAGNIKKALNLSREFLKYDPNHRRVLSNVKNYVEEIDEKEREQHEIFEDKPNLRPPSLYLDNRERYEALCRGERKFPSWHYKPSKLKCYLTTNGNSLLTVRPAKKEYVNRNPDVILYHDVITDDEIEALIDLAKPKLRRSMVVNSQSVGGVSNAEFRLSRGGWLEDSVHPVVARLTKRISVITGLSTLTEQEYRHAENLQVVNYGLGGHYEPHFDHAVDDEIQDIHLPGSRNRIATWMFYMSDVTAGGYTVFPEADVFVRPIKNAAVFWYNLKPSGESDDMTRHAGCPVLIGNKWVANKWIHEKGNEFTRRCNLYHD